MLFLLLLAMPRSWPHYHMFAILALFLIYYGLEQDLPSMPFPFFACLILYVVLGLFDGEVFGTHRSIILSYTLMVNHLGFVCIFFLWGISMLFLYGFRREIPPAAPREASQPPVEKEPEENNGNAETMQNYFICPPDRNPPSNKENI